MILLFEEYHYPLNTLEDALRGYTHLLTVLSNNKAKVQCVGYFYSVEKGDSIFILPKVFIKEIKYISQDARKEEKKFLALGRYNPENIIYIKDSIQNDDIKRLLRNGDRTVVFELSVWIYRAIAQFVNRRGSENVVNDIVIQNPISANGEKSQTLLDTILQLLEFHKKHRNLFTYISIVNSTGNNKIHWAKTISKTQPIVKKNNPYYIEFKNKNKAFNLDEELIVLFYSTLAYLSETYNFRIKSDVQYKIFPTHKIDDFIKYEGGTRLLKRIRRKYFTDELVKLWKLLYAFFEKAEQIESHRCHEDRLLVKNFNLVFEDMIDFLIGSKGEEVPKPLHNQLDGKIVDHIYKGTSLIDNHDIYYVGDSKYYSEDSDIGEHSIYKQFTYAKNIIQFNLNLLNDNIEGKAIKYKYIEYRDELTEGYDITPNFFIRGIIDHENISYSDDGIKPAIKNGKELISINKHFFNRLFDRDTIIIKEYNINFLFVLSYYASHIEMQSIKDKIRTTFRNNLIKSLNEAYSFFQVRPKPNHKIAELVKAHFYEFVGRMYMNNEKSEYIWVALEKGKEYGIDGDRRYPSISAFEDLGIVSEIHELEYEHSKDTLKKETLPDQTNDNKVIYNPLGYSPLTIAAEEIVAYKTK